MGLISRKGNRVRQRREAAQHTAPKQGLPTGKRALALSEGKGTAARQGQAKARADGSRGGTGKGTLAGSASGGLGERKCCKD